MRQRKTPFVPLKDLLQKNHDDRVQGYLDQMKGLSIDEIIYNTKPLNNSKKASMRQVANNGRRSATPDEVLMFANGRAS